MLLEYRACHPNLLNKYFNDQKKAGRKSSEITENEISDFVDKISFD